MLARQIEEGAPADLFFSADEAKMDALEKKGLLLSGTRRSLLSNLLVIIVPAEASADLKSAADLSKPEFKKIALADPHTVSVGVYAREYLQKAGLWDSLEEKVIPTENAASPCCGIGRSMDVGIVYKTDDDFEEGEGRVEISAGRPKFPSVAVVKSSRNLNAQRDSRVSRRPTARAVFEVWFH
jgi:molybdate transport system substrate-binding protein